MLCEQIAVLLGEVVYHIVSSSACYHKYIRRIGRIDTHIVLAHNSRVCHELVLCGEDTRSRCAAADISHLVAALHADIEGLSSSHGEACNSRILTSNAFICE